MKLSITRLRILRVAAVGSDLTMRGSDSHQELLYQQTQKLNVSFIQHFISSTFLHFQFPLNLTLIDVDDDTTEHKDHLLSLEVVDHERLSPVSSF